MVAAGGRRAAFSETTRATKDDPRSWGRGRVITRSEHPDQRLSGTHMTMSGQIRNASATTSSVTT